MTGEKRFQNRKRSFGGFQAGVEDAFAGVEKIGFGHCFDELSLLPDFTLDESYEIAKAVERVSMFITGLVFDDEIADERVTERRATGCELATGAAKVAGFCVEGLFRAVDC